MAGLLLGLSGGGNSGGDVLLMKSTSKGGFRRETRFWAERGIICCEDNIDGFSQLSVASFLRRAKALCDMLGRKSSAGDSGADASLRAEIQGYVNQAVAIAEKARIQGTPDDASARRDNARRRKTVMYVGEKGMM